MNKRLHEAWALSTSPLIPVSRKQKTFFNINSIWPTKTVEQIIELFKEDFTDTYRKIIKYIFKIFEYRSTVQIDQVTLANKTKTSRRSVQRCLDRLYELDIIRRYFPPKEHVNKNEVNRYYLNEHFFQEKILYPLRCFFSNVTDVLFTIANLFPGKINSPDLGAPLILEESLSFPKDKDKDSDTVPVPESYSTRVMRVRGSTGQVSGCKEKKEAMNKDSLTLIQNNLDKLPLTTKGILKLSVLPVQAVQEILKFGLNLNANDIFLYMWGVGKRKSTELGLGAFSFVLYDQQVRELKLSNDPYIDFDKLQELKQKQEATKKPSQGNTKYKQSAESSGLGTSKEAIAANEYKPTNSTRTPEEFMQVRKDTLQLFKKMREDGDTNVFRAMLIDAREKETDASPANPMVSDGPTIGEIKAELAALKAKQSMLSDNGAVANALRTDFTRDFVNTRQEPIAMIIDDRDAELIEAKLIEQATQVIVDCYNVEPHMEPEEVMGIYEGMNTNFLFGE